MKGKEQQSAAISEVKGTQIDKNESTDILLLGKTMLTNTVKQVLSSYADVYANYCITALNNCTMCFLSAIISNEGIKRDES